MTQWAEIRHMHLVDGVAKKVVAKRLGLDVKTVRRALARAGSPAIRSSPPRVRVLDAWRPARDMMAPPRKARGVE